MADEQEQSQPMEPLGPAYEPLQRRLWDDGAAWRARLPSTERLEQRLRTLVTQQPAAELRAADVKRRSRLQPISQRERGDTMFRGRFKVALAIISLAAVVALFVVLFHGFVGQKGGTAANLGGTPPATPASQATSFPAQHQYFPAIAPSDPRVVYKLVPINGSATNQQLARSTDGGATWHTFALPKVTGGIATPTVVFVSPLNPQVVFLTVTVALSSGTPPFDPCPPSVTASGLSGAIAFSGGSPYCGMEFVSQDGGAHWGQVHLPASAAPAALGDTSGYVLPVAFQFSNGASVFHVQGSRLYATTNVEPGSPPNSPEAQSTVTIRIVVSTDGGIHWTYADDALYNAAVANGQSICDYTASPSGSTLFAVTAAGCDFEAVQPSSLWRSDDAGAHWTRVGQLPNYADVGMITVSRGAGQMPLLYLNMTKETCTSTGNLPITAYSGGCSRDDSPANVQVSADGGKTWTAAPIIGFPTWQQPGNPLQNPGAPLGVLSDGSVLFVAYSGQTTNHFYTWKLGETSWQAVGPTFDIVSSTFVVVGAKDTVCVVTGEQTDFVESTFKA